MVPPPPCVVVVAATRPSLRGPAGESDKGSAASVSAVACTHPLYRLPGVNILVRWLYFDWFPDKRLHLGVTCLGCVHLAMTLCLKCMWISCLKEREQMWKQTDARSYVHLPRLIG